MTAENEIRAENKMKRLAAAIGVALAAVLAAASLSPARADAAGTSDGNLVIDVPTTVPCALMADGTVVSPSDWKITTSGEAYIASASASGFPANVEWSARTTDLAATQTGSVEVAGTGDTASVSGPSDPADAALATTARFEWSFSKLDAGKNSDVIGKAASGTAVLGSVTFTFAKPTTAFAVYSADDNSLTFYKRANVPAAGQMFEGKTATEVYEGVEKASYTAAHGAPWAGHAADITSVTVANEGIAPKSTSYWFGDMKALKSADVSRLDTSNVTDMGYMFGGCSSLAALDLSSFDTSNVTDMNSMFSGCKALTSLDLSSFDTGNVKNMYRMFSGCKALISLDLSSFDTSNVTSMHYMFEDCSALTSLDLSSFNTGKVTSMDYMFSGCSDLNTLDLSSFDTGNVTDMGYMFSSCGSLKSLDLSSFNTGKVANMSRMFSSCKALTSLGVSSFDTGNVTNISYMFMNCSALTTLDLSSFDTNKVTNMSYIFSSCKALQKVTFGAGWKWVGTNGYLPTPNSTYIAGADGKWYDTDGKGYAPKDIPSNKAMTYTAIPPKKAFAVYSADDQSLTFYKRPNVPTEGAQFLGKTATKVFTGFETKVYFSARSVPWSAYKSDVKTVTVADEGIAPRSTEMWFSDMAALGSADMLKLDTSNVVRMGFMFDSCGSLTSLDLSSFDTHNVMRMDGMFNGCNALTALDLSSFDTRNVTTMVDMFCNCKALTTLDLSSFDTRNVTSMSSMFSSCEALASLDLSTFDTSNVTSMSGMFNGCKALTTLDLSSFDTRGVTDMSDMFDGCTALTVLNLSSFDTGNVTEMNFFLEDCDSLERIALGTGFKWVGQNCFPPAGNWESVSTGKVYSEKEIPTGTADTYVSKPKTTAYAVWSDTDNSLTFYNRTEIPVEGATFNSKVATKVFTGFETKTYDYGRNIPWSAYRSDVKTVSVADEDLAPVSTANWFYYFTNVETIDLTKLDTRNVTNMNNMFAACTSLTTLDLSSFDTRNVANMNNMFGSCKALTTLDLSSFDTRGVTDMSAMFVGCFKLSVDCSNWDVSKVTNHSNFNANAPDVTVPLAWQASSDEGAEDSAIAPPCEKRENKNALSVPSESDELETGSSAKTSTDVVDATQKAVEEKAPEESSAAAETESSEKTGESKPKVVNEATKEDATVIVPEGAEESTAAKARE